jgi:hypothetical protein
MKRSILARLVVALTSVVVSLGLLSCVPSAEAESRSAGCATVSAGSAEPGKLDVTVTRRCPGGSGSQASPVPPTLRVDCGVNPATSSLEECQFIPANCTAEAAAELPGTTVTAIATYTLANGALRYSAVDCVTQGPVAPGLSEADVRAEVIKLVPSVGIKTAPESYALTQFESIFWTDTPTTRDLGAVELLGHRVAITITARSATWSFGDGTLATSAGPGRPYTAAEPCREVQCPAWFGHTYTKTGTAVVSATIDWAATYTVDGGAPEPIEATVAGPKASTTLPVKQARAVLMPDPTH